MGPAGRLIVGFGASSLAAVAIGAAICALSDVPETLWTRNLAAWALGSGLAVGLARLRPAYLLAGLPVAFVALAATFLNAPLQGVHRWIDAGPLHMNAAMLTLPIAVVGLSAWAERWWAWVAAFAILLQLAVQPDASQATSFAASLCLIAALAVPRRVLRAAVIAAALVIVLVAWMRPDPLQPVPEVEGVVGLAFGLGPALGLLAVASLAVVAITPAGMTARAGAKAARAGLALSACLAGWAITPFVGAYPVPLLGIGLSPVIGAWLGVGALAALVRAPNS